MSQSIIFFSFFHFKGPTQSWTKQGPVPLLSVKSFRRAEAILEERRGFEVEIQDSIYVDIQNPWKVNDQVPGRWGSGESKTVRV